MKVPENIAGEVTPPLPAQNDSKIFLPVDLRRLSGPAIRTFAAIADQWGLSGEQRRSLLGSSSRSAYYRWARRVREHRPFTLSVDVVTRISNVFGIHLALSILFATQSEANGWLRLPHQAAPFAGQSPLDFMANGTLEGLAAVRRFLDAACQGLYMPPGSIDADFRPYSDDEIAIKEWSDAGVQSVEAGSPTTTRATAERAARARITSFREEMSEMVGGMYDRGTVADLLGITVSDVDELHQARQIIGVPYARDDIRFPAAQFRNGAVVPGLAPVLAAFGDMNPWGQLQLLVVPIKGFTAAPASIFDILGEGVDEPTRGRIVALVRGWAA